MEEGSSTSAGSDKNTDQLDDIVDREELRRRYYGLMQELRVILPGVQVLLAFLLTVPFAQRFGELDDVGRTAFGVAMVTALLSAICLLTPVVSHRVGERTARQARLKWGIRMTVAGLGLLGISLVTALWCVARFIYGPSTAWAVATPVLVTIIALWILLPLSIGRQREHDQRGLNRPDE